MNLHFIMNQDIDLCKKNKNGKWNEQKNLEYKDIIRDGSYNFMDSERTD